MKFYRFEYYSYSDSSAGFAWFTNRAAAEKEMAKFIRENKESDPNPKLETVVIKPTKAEILKALKRYASHPDNG